MAFKVGIAQNANDLFNHLIELVEGRPFVSTPVFSGTGNGRIDRPRGALGAPTETWTLTCTAAAANGGTFSVTGSVSGAQAALTVGTPYSNAFFDTLIQDGATDFTVGASFTFNVTASTLPTIERWTVLRHNPKTSRAVTTNISFPSSSTFEFQMAGRRDYRINNNATYVGNGGPNITVSMNSGVSFLAWELERPQEVRSVLIRHTNQSSASIGRVTIQYSDNGSSWTTVVSPVNPRPYLGDGVYAVEEVPASGAYRHWRVVFERTVTGSTGTNVSLNISEILMFDGVNGTGNHVNNPEPEVILRAPGSDGTATIYTGMRMYRRFANDWVAIGMNGYTGYNPAEPLWHRQPGALTNIIDPVSTSPMTPLWDSPIPFWASASGRSLRFMTRNSSGYETGYLGLGLPYATPNQYPYPLIVGASTAIRGNQSQDSAEFRFSNSTTSHASVPIPSGSATSISSAVSNLNYLDFGGAWQRAINRVTESSNLSFSYDNVSFRPTSSVSQTWPHSFISESQNSGFLPYGEVVGGGRVAQPVVIIQRNPRMVYGELEGFVYIGGLGLNAEDTVTIDGTQYVIGQNAFRAANTEYFGFALED